MSETINPTVKLLETDPEIKSFIYQQMVDFEPFVTSKTVVTVVAKDPQKLAAQFETEDDDDQKLNTKNLHKMHRIAIVIMEEGTSLEEEALHENIYDAIRLAKLNLLNKLNEIQNSVISHSERVDQINQIMANTRIH